VQAIFAYQVSDPQRYGVMSFDYLARAKIEEKPTQPQSSFAECPKRIRPAE
jgi:glucose-1-phosphate thymidylyltransferase